MRKELYLKLLYKAAIKKDIVYMKDRMIYVNNIFFCFFLWGRRTNNNIRRVYGGRVGGNQKNKITQVQDYTVLVVVVSTILSLRSVNKLFAQKHILYI